MYTILNYAKDIIELIKDEIKEPIHIIGHSLGGIVAMFIASEIPSLVKCIINGDGGFNKEHMTKWILTAANASDGVIKAIELSKTKNDLLKLFAYNPINLPDMKEPILTIDAPGVEIGILAYQARSYKFLDTRILSQLKQIDVILEGYNADEFLPKIECPVLLLRADTNLNSLMIDEDIELAKKHIKDLYYKKYIGIGHNLFFEDFFPVLNQIVNFLIIFLD
jgi:pimeloyl-ACP methyl ester carboxylesterase